MKKCKIWYIRIIIWNDGEQTTNYFDSIDNWKKAYYPAMEYIEHIDIWQVNDFVIDTENKIVLFEK